MFLRLFGQKTHFVDSMAERLLTVNVLAVSDRVHGNSIMRMLGSRHENGVDVFADLVKHHPVIRPELDTVQAFLTSDGFLVPCFVNIAQGNHIVAPGQIVCIARALLADTDTGNIELAVGRRARLENVERRHTDNRRGHSALEEIAAFH